MAPIEAFTTAFCVLRPNGELLTFTCAPTVKACWEAFEVQHPKNVEKAQLDGYEVVEVSILCIKK